MKFAIVLLSVFSISASAQTIEMICQMGDSADMDIKIESIGAGKERLSVILMGMDGETVTTYVNSSFLTGELSRQLAGSGLRTVVSTSDLRQAFGGAFLNAGMVDIQKSKTNHRYDVLFAAKDNVYSASCAP